MCVCSQDRDPRLFEHVLAFLRAPSEPIEGVLAEDEPAFKRELMYYGLETLVYSGHEMRSPAVWHDVDLHTDEDFDVRCEYAIWACTHVDCRACELERRDREITVRHLADGRYLTDFTVPNFKPLEPDFREGPAEYHGQRLARCSHEPVQYRASVVDRTEIEFGQRYGGSACASLPLAVRCMRRDTTQFEALVLKRTSHPPLSGYPSPVHPLSRILAADRTETSFGKGWLLEAAETWPKSSHPYDGQEDSYEQRYEREGAGAALVHRLVCRRIIQ